MKCSGRSERDCTSPCKYARGKTRSFCRSEKNKSKTMTYAMPAQGNMDPNMPYAFATPIPKKKSKSKTMAYAMPAQGNMDPNMPYAFVTPITKKKSKSKTMAYAMPAQGNMDPNMPYAFVTPITKKKSKTKSACQGKARSDCHAPCVFVQGKTRSFCRNGGKRGKTPSPPPENVVNTMYPLEQLIEELD